MMIKKLLWLVKKIIFQIIGTKMKPGSLKKLIDFSFTIIEKIAIKFQILTNFYIEIYGPIVKRELEMLKVSKMDKILVTGCGSLPATVILLAQQTNNKIIAIDKDQDAIEKAKKIIRKKCLQKQVKIYYANVSNYNIDDFDIIFLLYGLKNQKNILKYVWKNISVDTNVVLRSVIKDNKIKVDERFEDLSEYFKIKDFFESQSLGKVNSILLKKKEK